jgi:hypothetical protein
MAGKGRKRVSQSVARSAQATVTSTRSLIAWGNAGGSTVYLHQDGNSNHAIYIGGADVTTTNGFLIHKGEQQTINLPEGVALYAVSSNSETLYVLQTGGI